MDNQTAFAIEETDVTKRLLYDPPPREAEDIPVPDIPDMLNTLDRSPRIAIDCETTSLNYMLGELHGISLAGVTGEWYVPIKAKDDILPALQDMARSKPFIFWNAPFDLHFLERNHFSPPQIIDAQIMAYLVNENQSMALKELAPLKLGILETMPDFKDLLREAKKRLRAKRLEDVNIYDIPAEKLIPYACGDARLTYDVLPILEEELRNEGMEERFYTIEMPFLRILKRMEAVGIAIDNEYLAELKNDLMGQLGEMLFKWNDITGGINPNSPQQLSDYLYGTLGHKVSDTTPTGMPSTAKLCLKRLLSRDKNGAVKLILEIRAMEKLIGTYLNNFETMQIDGRLHCSLNRTGTVTGRLSADSPNLQNVPIRTKLGRKLRALFIASLSRALLVADYSALEMRIMAHYSQDKNLLRIFRDKLDPHNLTANAIKASRDDAKIVNYQKSYLSSPYGIADMIEESTGVRPKIKEVRRWMEEWDKAYPGVEQWQEKALRYAHELLHVRTIGGRKRHLPELAAYAEGIRNKAERQAINSIIQGSAADIIQLAMIRVSPYLDWYGADMLLQIHDELVNDVPEGVGDDLLPVLQREMEGVGEELRLRVPLVAEPKLGRSWADAK